jgi:hypothetical protein
MSIRRRGLGWAGVLISLGSCVFVSCAGRTSGSDSRQAGTLGLRLRTEINQVAYRLRDGVFEVTGTGSAILNSEEDVNAASLERTLAVGGYEIELLPGWRIERESASGFEPLNAQLTSANPLPFTIESGQRTSVRYDFFTDGIPIGLDDGTLDVSIGITDTSQPPANPAVFDPAACDFVSTTGCEQLTCDSACAGDLSGFCLDRCQVILECVLQSNCASQADPLCAVRTQGQPNFCSVVVEQGGGLNASNPTSPVVVARRLVECSCSVPRPGTPPADCAEGDTRACGPAAAIGSCRPGVQTCNNGVFSACQGAVFPAPRDCLSSLDNDCDGFADDTIDGICACVIGDVQSCDGHPGMDGLGRCRPGQQLCEASLNNASSAFGACLGALGPLESDSCTIPGDDSNCDGIINGGCSEPTPTSSFQLDLSPIFQAQCSPCHTTLRRGGHSVGSADLTTAFADATRLGATLIQRLNGGGMPPACTGLPGDPGCISVANLAAIQLWIDSGMAP